MTTRTYIVLTHRSYAGIETASRQQPMKARFVDIVLHSSFSKFGAQHLAKKARRLRKHWKMSQHRIGDTLEVVMAANNVRRCGTSPSIEVG